MKNEKIISPKNPSQHLYISRNLSEQKIKLILSYLVRNFSVSERSKLTAKCLLVILPLYKGSPTI